MKLFKNSLIGIVVIAIIITAPVSKIFAQQQAQSEEDQKMMKIWLEYSTPGPNHKYLEYFAGIWDTTSKMWMKPGSEPVSDKMEMNARMILGGRYIYCDMKGTMMGQPAEGVQIMGYDNYNKKFLTFWIDSSGTGFFPLSGTLESTGKIKTETGLWDDIMTGGKSEVKTVTTIIDKDKFTFEMYMLDGKGGEFKSMELVYTRKK